MTEVYKLKTLSKSNQVTLNALLFSLLIFCDDFHELIIVIKYKCDIIVIVPKGICAYT